MKKDKLLAVFGAALLAIGTASCASMEAQKSMDEATAEIDKAKAMGNEWRDSRKMLKKAQTELDAGNTDKAMELIAAAKKQGMDAQLQAEQQANAGPH